MSNGIPFTALPQFINPQHTDKVYNEPLYDQTFSTPRASSSLASSYVNTPTSHMNTRGLTLDMSDASSFVSEPSPAGSLGSSPGCLAPSSCSSNSSSRRQSIILSDQQYYQASPTPVRRSKAQHQQVNHNHMNGLMSPFSDPTSSASTSFSTDSFQSSMSDGELLMNTDMYPSRTHSMDWQYVQPMGNLSTSYDQGLVPLSMSMDLAANFDASMSEHIMDNHVDEHAPLTLFTAAPRHRSIAPSRIVHQQSPPMLAEPFEPLMQSCNQSLGPLSPLSLSNHTNHRQTARTRQGLSSLRRAKAHKSNEPRWRTTLSVIPDTKDSKHRCSHVDPRGILCGQTFRRPEHLKRHERKHLSSEESNMIQCQFGTEFCKKSIKDRPDNMRAHLKHTHFTYGKTESGGKNKRFSMRHSQEMGLRLEDERWTLLLQHAITFGDTETWFYKMLGYSIKDTAEIAVRDIAPEWEGAEDAMLKDFDPRWKQLLSGNMTFEQAMERGRFMPEEEKEGILGVDMATSEQMGLRDLDPRWKCLDEGKMSLEMCEKLEVNHSKAARACTAGK